MIITSINQKYLKTEPLYYSRWHSCSTPEKGSHYDIRVAGIVGLILSVSDTTFVVCTYLTDLETLKYFDDDFIFTPAGLKVWNISIGVMCLEDNIGVRFVGTLEAFSDSEDELKVIGSNCIFTDNEDEAYIESFFSIRDLIPRPHESREIDFDYSSAIEFVTALEPIMQEILPEKFI